uniref:Uncharacterized protein n=1 Tax=Cacopsylla melanoneura TaxID=428564 RepID=A0A8D8YBW9_9HEMI
MAKKSDSTSVSRKKCSTCKKNIPIAFNTCSECSKGTLRKTRGSQRRTQRTTREKPKYFDSSAFQKKRKKQANPYKKPSTNGNGAKDRPAVKPKSSEKANNGQSSSSQPSTPKAKNVRKTREPKDTEEESSNVILTEKSKQCSIILSEINRKFAMTSWRV